MAGKRDEPEERRRPTAELNLMSEAKARSAAASKGCASLIGRVFVLLMILGLGLG